MLCKHFLFVMDLSLHFKWKNCLESNGSVDIISGSMKQSCDSVSVEDILFYLHVFYWMWLFCLHQHWNCSSIHIDNARISSQEIVFEYVILI